MQNDQASLTAQKMGLLRAAHQLLDHPLILDDPVALALAGPHGRARIRAGARRLNRGTRLTLRAFAVARSRIVEEELQRGVARGVRQFVVLGAGLDTFAYRNPHASHGLRVFEVDHPATQALKRQLLAAAQVEPPPDMRFVPVDFATDALAARLREAGFRHDEPALFSWLGVSMYLPRAPIASVLEYVAAAPPGSGIVFDYLAPLAHAPLLLRLRLRALSGLLALKGEPWVSFFEPEPLATWLETMGFARMQDFDTVAINARFFDSRIDRLRVTGPAHVMVAGT